MTYNTGFQVLQEPIGDAGKCLDFTGETLALIQTI